MQLCGWISYCHHKETVSCFYKVLVPYRCLYSPSLSGLIQPFISIRALNVENWITGLVGLFLKIDRCKIHFCSYEFLQGCVCVCVCVCVLSLSCIWVFAISWTVACRAPLSMGFSKQEYWSGLPFPSPGNLPKPGIEPDLPDCRWFFTVWATRECRFF